MTKRDFVAIAGACRHATQDLYDRGKYAELEGAHEVIGRLAALFAVENSRFNRDEFWNAVREVK